MSMFRDEFYSAHDEYRLYDSKKSIIRQNKKTGITPVFYRFIKKLISFPVTCRKIEKAQELIIILYINS